MFPVGLEKFPPQPECRLYVVNGNESDLLCSDALFVRMVPSQKPDKGTDTDTDKMCTIPNENLHQSLSFSSTNNSK